MDTRRESAGPHVWLLDLRWQRGAVAQETTLRVVGQVVTEVTVQPPALTLLADEPGTPTVVVTDLRQVPLTIRAVATTSPRVRQPSVTPQRVAAEPPNLGDPVGSRCRLPAWPS